MIGCMPSPRVLLCAGAVATVALAGCGIGGRSAPEAAAANADAEAEAVGERIARWQIDEHTAVQFARLASSTKLGHGSSIEVIRAQGDARNNDGVLVVRITAEGETEQAGTTVAQATRCYRYAVTMYGEAKASPVEPCAGLTAISIPVAPPQPRLPDRANEQIEAALGRLSPAQRSDPDAVRRAVELGVGNAVGARFDTAVRGSAIGATATVDRN
jgi:hypothetical protein